MEEFLNILTKVPVLEFHQVTNYWMHLGLINYVINVTFSQRNN